jgi:hypothetical protein
MKDSVVMPTLRPSRPIFSFFCLGVSTLLMLNSCSNKHIVSIAITPPNASVSQTGQTTLFQAVGTTNHAKVPPEALTSGVTWTSSTPSIATITPAGLATAVGCGTTTISAQDGSVEGQTTFTNTCVGSGQPPILQSIGLFPSNPTMTKLQQTTQFIALAVYLPAGSNNLLTSLATWASSNTSIATVDTTGLATAVSCGSTTITAEYLGLIGQTPVTVQCSGNQTLQSITVLPLNPTVPVIGQTTQFLALGTLVGGGQDDLTQTATWSSSNTTIANFIPAGQPALATTLGCGTSTISAEFQPTGGTPIVGTTPLNVSCNSIVSIELLVEKSGSVVGTVTSMPAGIDCGQVCGGLFNEGTGFRLTASPTPTWVTGCDQVIPPTTGACYFTLVPDSPGGTQKVVTVTF